jgi:hypothetical protein
MADASFGEDLRRGLELSKQICHIRIEMWQPIETSTISAWQTEAIAALQADEPISEINRAWQLLADDRLTAHSARLLHSELVGVIEIQESVLALYHRDDETLGGLADASGGASIRRRLPTLLKRAAGSMKTLLESLKDILEASLGGWAKVAVQLVIEAHDFATK